jgi:hypothetical protein
MSEFDAMLNALDAKHREEATVEQHVEAARAKRHEYWLARTWHAFKPERLMPEFCWRCGRNKRLHPEKEGGGG